MKYTKADRAVDDIMGTERLPNIHRYETSDGRTMYAVCQWIERSAQYQCPLDKIDAKLTGCHTEVARIKSYFGGYNRNQAYGRARTLWGWAKIAQ